METALEKKYGKNDMNALIVCGRCLEPVPASLRTITVEDRFGRAFLCLKEFYKIRDQKAR
jgi:hypothetical protein